MIKTAGYKNINFFGAEPDSMEAAISRPQDLVIAAPNSSNFDLIRDYPDYLLHFKKEEMDALFAQEKAVLEGCSKFVAEKGTLIYCVYTISKKEGIISSAKMNSISLLRKANSLNITVTSDIPTELR